MLSRIFFAAGQLIFSKKSARLLRWPAEFLAAHRATIHVICLRTRHYRPGGVQRERDMTNNLPTPSREPTAPSRLGDFWGGLAAMLVAIPSAIAFGVATFAALGPAQAGYGATAGLVGAVVIGLVASVFGGAPRIISSPCAPAAAVMGALAAELAAGGNGSVEHIVLLMTLAALISASLQIAYGLIGGGTLIKFIPFPVVSGYLSGVGLLILYKQIPSVLGLAAGTGAWHGLVSPALWQWPSVIITLATIAAMAGAVRVTKVIPAAIIGLMAGLAVYAALAATLRPDLGTLAGNKFVIGRLEAGLGRILHGLSAQWHALSSLTWSDARAMLMPALTLSVLLSMDTLKTCVVVDALTRTRHNSNRTLLGQGLGNLASALAGGVPGAGMMGATLVSVTSGGQTRLSGILEAVFVFVAFVLLGSLIGWVPLAALGGILVVVGFRMIDRNTFQLLKHKGTLLDFAVIVAVVATAVSVSLIAAAGVGVLLSVVLFIREQIRGSVIRSKVTGSESFSKQRRLPEERAILEEYGGQTIVCVLQSSLFFGTTDQLRSELETDLKRCRYLILDMRRVQTVDFTAAHILEQMADQLAERGGRLILSGLPKSLPSGQNLRNYFDDLGVVRKNDAGALLVGSRDEALEWAENTILAEHSHGARAEEAPLDLSAIDLFRRFDAGALNALAACIATRSVPASEAIFRAGASGDEMFIIRRGRVRITLPLRLTEKQHRLASFARGDFFGDLGFLTGRKRIADALAEMPTDLFVLARPRFDELSRGNPIVGAMFFARLAEAVALRLRDTDKELRKLKDE